MTYTLPPESFESPGAYVDHALNQAGDLVLGRAVRRMLEDPEPIPKLYRKLCGDVTRYVLLSSIERDTDDLQSNRVAHIRGLHWGYALAQATSLEQPLHMAIAPFGSTLDRAQQLAGFSEGVDAYERFSNKALHMAYECGQVADPVETHPRLTRRGIISGLYMVDMGIRQRRDMEVNRQLDGILAMTEVFEKEAAFQSFRDLMEAGGFPDPEL